MPKKPAKKETKKAPAKKSAPKQPKIKKPNDHAGYGHSPQRTVRV